MNMFYLNENPKVCSIEHCDKHIVKMPLEHIKMEYFAHIKDKTYFSNKPHSYFNHPVSIWVRESIENYRYIAKLTMELFKEYTFRYGKTHAWEVLGKWLLDNEPDLPNIPMTKIPLCMDDKYKTDNPTQSYKNYYIGDKLRFAKWTKRNIPKWINKND